MPKSEPVSNYVTLGQLLYILRIPYACDAFTYLNSVTPFLQMLETCGFAATRAAANVINGITLQHLNGRIVPAHAAHMAAAVGPIVETLNHEMAGRKLIVLRPSDVSRKLRQLPDQLTLTECQKHLHDETVLCIETGAYRAAVVSGWSLAYDCIRRWTWDDPERRKAFNRRIKAKTRSGAKVYPRGLATYESFYSIKPTLGEHDVLEAMRDAKLLTGVYDKLEHALRERNAFAHANHVVPSPDQSNRYIDNLIDIITSPPFLIEPPSPAASSTA